MNMAQLASTAEQTTTTAAEVLLGTVDKNGSIWLNTGEVVMTVLTGVCIVFGMLILLSLIIFVFGKLMDSSNNEKTEEKPVVVPKAEPVKPQAPVPTTEVTDPSVVAAIMAAISCVLGKGNFRIRKITRASTRGNWGASGASDNVKPF